MNTHAEGLHEKRSSSDANSFSKKQDSVYNTSQFLDNRPEIIAQNQLHEMANNSMQQKQAAQLMSIANSKTGNTIQFKGAVVQRNKHTKRLLNVLSLGIRKAYTYNKKKRMANAVQNDQQPQAPVVSPMDQFVGAYEKSRYYQQTDPQNLPSIEEHGLLNYEDRERLLPENVIGMSRLGGEYEGDEKKGVFLGPKPFMKQNKMTNNVARAFLPAERTKIHHWSEENQVPRQEMYLDEKFRGGAVVTKDSIPPEQVTTGNMSDLLGEDNPKLENILAAVGSQYEGETPDKETMKEHLRQAILERRLSNVAFDNL